MNPSKTDERAELLQRLEEIPRRLRERLDRGIPTQPREGEWSVNAMIGHLTRVEEEVFQPRLRQMATEENPRWQYWSPEGFDWEAEYAPQPLEGLLSAYSARRNETVAFLRALSEEGWQRRGTHAVYGVLDVTGLCRIMLDHDEEHLAQLNQMT